MGRTDYPNPAYDDIEHLRTVIQPQDQKFRLSITMSYAIPFKQGFSTNQLVKALSKGALGGWTVTGVAEFQSAPLIGTPAGVISTGVDPTKPTAYWTGPSLQRWINTCTITASGARQNCLGTDEPAAWIIPQPNTLFEISPRFASMKWVRPPEADVSIFKSFPIKERLNFNIAAQAFNITNTPWFGAGAQGAGWNSNVNSPSFGLVNFAQGNIPRQMQVAAKVTW
jgi:hypothetical protein